MRVKRLRHVSSDASIAGFESPFRTNLRTPDTRASYGWQANLHAKVVHSSSSCAAQSVCDLDPALKRLVQQQWTLRQPFRERFSFEDRKSTRLNSSHLGISYA